MANLTIQVARVRLVRGDDNAILTLPMGEAGTGGQYFRLNTTSGKLEKGNGASAAELGTDAGILLDSVATINLTGTIARWQSGAILDLGDALDALAFDAAVFIGDTDATLSDTAGTVSRVMGRVIPNFANSGTTADKLLHMVEV